MRPTARALDASYRVSSDRGKGGRRLRQSAEPSCPGGQSACDPGRQKSAPWTSIRGLPRDYRIFRKEEEVVALLVIAVTDLLPVAHYVLVARRGYTQPSPRTRFEVLDARRSSPSGVCLFGPPHSRAALALWDAAGGNGDGDHTISVIAATTAGPASRKPRM